jgi:hypothetical protein
MYIHVNLHASPQDRLVQPSHKLSGVGRGACRKGGWLLCVCIHSCSVYGRRQQVPRTTLFCDHLDTGHEVWADLIH